ncbi:hypothetical protein H1230_17110 [Paenibacillus sp. 19GGS1-52]|uniref:hypothetical protein n=1 Tax=Paenibacillus sp. 19GGS1-52 TaxID=2758563 RepID=UPI001EFA96C5|nr:hypothetical protein [Paenibacillus sp. 19GGS1-52]ULO04863.1 hypothetical protein H1230_17110 [Paenibacillus sp. 19GGS1-52]
MSQTFNSRKKTKKPWLDRIYLQRKNRTFELGKRSIDELRKQGIKISYRKIAEISKLIDEEKKGIHPNSIKTNAELYNYYKENVQIKTILKKSLSTSFKSDLSSKKYNLIKPDRDVQALRNRYMKFKKNELVELLINAEQYIAKNNQRWIVSQFEKFKE